MAECTFLSSVGSEQDIDASVHDTIQGAHLAHQSIRTVFGIYIEDTDHFRPYDCDNELASLYAIVFHRPALTALVELANASITTFLMKQRITLLPVAIGGRWR